MRFLLLFLVYLSALAAITFGSAGRVDLPWFWAVLASYLALMVVTLRSLDPDLLRERLHPRAGGRDRRFRWFLLPLYLAHLAVAGLDVGRYHWSTTSVWVQPIGLVLFISGLGLAGWAMSVNRFFSPVIRVQEERGHRLVTDGPYCWVRHPGYSGLLVCFLGSALALGSWWSLVPLTPVFFLVLRRTVLEDRFLKRELEGYDRYADRVRYRLIPGVW